MSREQRRLDRKAQARGGGAPPSRRTPVKVSGGSSLPTVPLAIAGGILVVVALIAYLVIQSNSGASASAAEKAAADSSSSIPGTYVPDQGRAHLSGGFTLSRTPIPFCPGVKWSGAPEGEPSGTATAASASSTPTAVPTGSPSPAPTDPSHGNLPIQTAAPTDCRSSNPPSSGKHLNVQNNVDVGGGNLIKIPPDPDVYPDDIFIPRDAIPHILEHAGVFVGYNCADGDTACQDVVKKLADIVNARIDRNDHSSRVVMARDPDLVVGTMGMSSWTRVLTMTYQEFDGGKVDDFIAQNACRVDWESFCR